MVNRRKVAEAHGQPFGADRGRVAVDDVARRHDEGTVPLAFFVGQKLDEGGVEVGLAGAFEQRWRAAGGKDAAVVHRDQPVEIGRFFHVGGCHQYAHAAAAGADARDELPELAARERIYAGRRFVEDQQIGIVDQRAAKAELLLHSARKLAGGAVAEWREAGAVEQLIDARGALGAILAEQSAEKVDVLEHRQRHVKILAQPLRHVGNARANRVAVALVAHVAAQYLNLSGLYRTYAGQQREQAGLAHAVRADQPDHAPGGNV